MGEIGNSANPGHDVGAAGHRAYLLADRWRILPAENRITGPDLDRRIPDKFMRVLVHLLEHPGVVSRDELMSAVWPDTVVVDEVLTRSVSELRKVFGDDPRRPQVIETIPKRGYRLLATVAPLIAGDRTPIGAVKQGRQSRWRLIGLAAVVVVAFGVWFTGDWNEVAPSTPTLLQLTSLPGVEEYPALTPAGDRLAFAWEGDDDTPTGIFVLTVGEEEPLALTSVPGHYAFPAWSHDTRHVAYARLGGDQPGIHMISATGGDERLLVPVRQGRPSIEPDFAPDGRSLVFSARTDVRRHWRLESIDLESREITALTEPTGEVMQDRRPRYSPTGDRLAFMRLRTEGLVIAVMAVDGGEVTILPLGERIPVDLAWSGDGGFLLVTASDGLWELDVSSGARRLISADRNLTGVSAARSPRLVAYTQGHQDWSIWELPLQGLDGTMPGRPLIASSLYDGQPAPSPDGRRIAFASQRGGEPGLWIMDRDGGNARAVIESPTLESSTPAWSPDGTEIAFRLVQGSTSAVAVCPADGGEMRVLTEEGRNEGQPSWSHDGRWIYFCRSADDGIDLWKRPRTGGEAVRVTWDGGWRGRETPDGTRFLFNRSRRDTLGIWSIPVAGGEPTLAFPLAEGELVSWTTAPDGIYLCWHGHVEDWSYRVEFRRYDGSPSRLVAELDSRGDPDLAFDPANLALLYSRAGRRESDLVGILDY
ncbi:MAG: hypothetical protein GY838_15005 [bacterium]|nr:hypothetical protein [bacterium]